MNHTFCVSISATSLESMDIYDLPEEHDRSYLRHTGNSVTFQDEFLLILAMPDGVDGILETKYWGLCHILALVSFISSII